MFLCAFVFQGQYDGGVRLGSLYRAVEYQRDHGVYGGNSFSSLRFAGRSRALRSALSKEKRFVRDARRRVN